MNILLVNPNRVHPPIAPIALDYLGSALQAASNEVSLLDLNFALNPMGAIDHHLSSRNYDLIGVTIRNTEDCFYPGRTNYLPLIERYIQRIRKHSKAPIILGGAGFSVMPEAIMLQMSADFGIRGEGEFSLVRFANGEDEIPGLLWPTQDGVTGRPSTYGDLSQLPPMRRDLVDNRRYYKRGANVGFETKRGCNALCTYCVDPLSKGRRIRLRPPSAIVQELGYLAEQGVEHLHTGDAEFNRPLNHALEVCQEIIKSGLHKKIKWYAYCAPTPFSNELAEAMREAGCLGILIGGDHTEEHMLRALGRDFSEGDIRDAVEACHRYGIISYVSLLFGGPGETTKSVQSCLTRMGKIPADLIGACLGLRVFPGTSLAAKLQKEGATLRGPGAGNNNLIEPAFYIPPDLGDEIFRVVRDLSRNDSRIIFMDPEARLLPVIYPWLMSFVIRLGYKGAHWDIVRRLKRLRPSH